MIPMVSYCFMLGNNPLLSEFRKDLTLNFIIKEGKYENQYHPIHQHYKLPFLVKKKIICFNEPLVSFIKTRIPLLLEMDVTFAVRNFISPLRTWPSLQIRINRWPVRLTVRLPVVSKGSGRRSSKQENTVL